MGAFRIISDRARGAVAATLQNRIAAELDGHIRNLLDAAVDLWAENNWYSYDDGEDNCTVQLYRWCMEVARRDSRFALITPQFQWFNISPDVLLGLADVATSTRPDLRFQVGVSGRAVECKRLSVNSPWPREYVRQGIGRFAMGSYGHAEDVGFMVGYCQDGELELVVERINLQVLSDERLDGTQVLEVDRPGHASCWSRSCHPRSDGRPICLNHLVVRQQPLGA